MMDENRSDRLEGLWAAYRQATPEPEPSINFMPELWTRIDGARPTSWAMPLARLASRLLPLAAALTLAMSVYTWSPGPSSASYVDNLASDLLQELAGGEENI